MLWIGKRICLGDWDYLTSHLISCERGENQSLSMYICGIWMCLPDSCLFVFNLCLSIFYIWVSFYLLNYLGFMRHCFLLPLPLLLNHTLEKVRDTRMMQIQAEVLHWGLGTGHGNTNLILYLIYRVGCVWGRKDEWHVVSQGLYRTKFWLGWAVRSLAVEVE